ncbi:MAG: hypothetical protein GY903_22095 [Fuerstiella sp.]|nr:hypothetical protein [Fuerstiella sp.]
MLFDKHCPETDAACCVWNPHAVQSLCTGMLTAVVVSMCCSVACGQPTYRGLPVGTTSKQEVITSLGLSPIRTGNADDLRYPVAGSDSLSDRLYFHADKLALVTAASGDDRYPNRQAIEDIFGRPEAQVLFQTQQYLDYTEQGLKFICATDGTTTGIVSFAPQKRRVPAGGPNVSIDLRRRQPHARPNVHNTCLIKVGTAERSIAPTEFDNLLPQGSDVDLDLAEELLARVVVFERNGRKIVFAGLDVFGLGPWDVDRLRTSLATKGFANVIVAMSHTHANVDTIGFYGYYPEQYAQHILAQTEAAVLAANANLKSVQRLQTGTTEMPLAGGRVIDLIRNGRDPGLVDPTVSILQAIGSDGVSLVNVINLACHPEVIRLERARSLSPDFVGTLCREVTARLGGQTVFLNGALGGMLTPDTRFRTNEAATTMGSALAEFVVTAAQQAVPCQSDILSIETQSIELPVTGESVALFLENAPRPIEMHNGRIRTDMNVIWIGEAQFITVPGELLPDIGFEIMQAMSGRLRSIVSLANGELGYLVPNFDFREDGYEERTGPGREAGEIVRRTGLKLATQSPRNP